MKSILTKVLDEAIILLDRRTPQTNRVIKSIDIGDVSPLEIVSFMKDNNVPDNAYFGGENNGYDGWVPWVVLLCWEIDIPTTEKERLEYRRKKFDNIIFPMLFKELTKLGYKRKGFDSGLFKPFKDTTVYDMYINKEFDRLVEYYGLYFSLS